MQNRRMLPSLRPTQSKDQIDPLQKQLTKSAVPKSSRAAEQALSYEQKCQAEMILNAKLKELFANIKSNVDTSKTVNAEEEEIVKVMKERKKEEREAQHQAHILNMLISENAKLKQQVDSERNKRAIYFNVYKNLEHEIHHWEVEYKNLLIETIKSEGAIEKIKEKYRKASKKLEKDIQTINLELQNIGKLEQINQKSEQNANRSKTPKDLSRINSPVKSACKKEEPAVQIQSDDLADLSIVKKHQDEELEYEMQQKSLELTGTLTRLRQISKLNNLDEIVSFFEDIDQQIDYQYGLFKEEEKREKEIGELIEAHRKEIRKIQAENQERKSTKVVKGQGKTAVEENTIKIKELEKSLEERIGVKACQMSNEMLLHHCLRVRDERKEGKRNLDKYLEQAKKEKPEASILLNPKEMHKKIIESQTAMI